MPRFLIDVNLPYQFSLWSGDDYMHVRDLGETWSDSQIWAYARDRDLVIVSKDTDFSDRLMVSVPPPRVIHIRIGNMRMRDFYPAPQNLATDSGKNCQKQVNSGLSGSDRGYRVTKYPSSNIYLEGTPSSYL